MSGVKHTQGPWRVIESDLLPFTGDHVADMSNGLMVVAFAKLGAPLADARLIAAAPELLSSLIDIYAAYCNVMHSEFDFPSRPWTPERDNDLTAINARAAIAKATGETP